MSLTIPTTSQQTLTNLSNLETRLNQESPLADQAFQRVLAGMEGLAFTTLYKFGVERALQNLVSTASEEDLDRLGIEAGVVRKPSESANHTATLPGTNGTTIPINTDFIGDGNGIRYFTDAAVIVAGGVATLDMTAETPGVIGNLLVGDTLSIGTQVAGAETQATVTVINTIGAEEETDEAYRLRILNALRTTLGGGNSEDYKAWSEEVSGVFRASPYSGQPIGSILTSVPGDRTVYIEADSTIDPDGIAPSALLDDVRDNINTDPVTLKSREPLGLTDSTLWVESIYMTSIFTEIDTLDVDATILTQVKADIDTALDLYYRSITPFLPGIDYEPDRNDSITKLTVSEVVQDVVKANGGTCQGVEFGLAPSVFETIYTLEPGEKTKDGGVVYV